MRRVLEVGESEGILANDIDPTGTLRIEPGATMTAHGATVELRADGGFTYTPASIDRWGIDDFAYTAIDARGRPTTAKVEIAVRPTLVSPSSLHEEAGFTLSHSGCRGVARAGDVDGDGLADLVATVDRSLVMFGRPDASDIDASALETGPEGFSIALETRGAPDLANCRGVGDLNADGRDDLGCVRRTFMPEAIAVVFGRSATTPINLQPEIAPATAVYARLPERYRSTGWTERMLSLAPAGDHDGDGIDDLAVGFPWFQDSVSAQRASCSCSWAVPTSKKSISSPSSRATEASRSGGSGSEVTWPAAATSTATGSTTS